MISYSATARNRPKTMTASERMLRKGVRESMVFPALQDLAKKARDRIARTGK